MSLPVTAEPLPSTYTFGKVVGRVIHLIADTAEDTDDKPQARAAAGRVTFAPKEVLRKTTGPDYPAIVLHATESANLSSSGRVLDAEGRQGIWLAVGIYTVTFEITGAARAIPSFEIEVTTAHTDEAPLDLAAYVPYVPPTGTVVQTVVVPSGGTTGQVLVRNASGGLVWADQSGGASVVDASTTTKGIVELATTGETTTGTDTTRAVTPAGIKAVIASTPRQVYGATGGRVLTARLDSFPTQLTLPSFSLTTVPFPRPLYANGVHLTTANALVVPPGGDGAWDIGAAARFNAGAAGMRTLAIHVNDVVRIRGKHYAPAVSGTNNDLFVTTQQTLQLKAGDVVTVKGDATVTGVIVNAQFLEEVVCWMTRRGALPVKPVVVGHTGGALLPGVKQEAMNVWTARANWTDVATIDSLTSYAEFNTWKAANPDGLTNVASALIPHSQPAGNWNALLDEVIAGQHDDAFVTQGQRIAQNATSDVVVRPWWEFNVEAGVDPTKFIAAWNRAIPILRQSFATAAPTKRLRIAWCYLPAAAVTTFEDYYPGNSTVDVVDADVYGYIYGTTNPTSAAVLAAITTRLNELSVVAAKRGKPIGLSEWGNAAILPADGTPAGRGLGDSPEFIDRMFDFMEQNAVAYALYFNLPDGGIHQDLHDTPLSLARYVERANLL